MQDIICFPKKFFIVFYWLLATLARFSLSVVHCLGALLGWGVYIISSRYRHRFKQNFNQAFPNDKTLLSTVINQAKGVLN